MVTVTICCSTTTKCERYALRAGKEYHGNVKDSKESDY